MQTLIYQFEEQFREIEKIKLVVRQGRNEPAKAAYDYKKKLSGASTVTKLRERIAAKLGEGIDYDLLDENMNQLHGLSKLSNVRKAQKNTLPS